MPLPSTIRPTIGLHLRHIRLQKGFTVELPTPKGCLMEALLFHVAPIQSAKGSSMTERKTFLVLSGTVKLLTPDRSYVLETGDCAYFPKACLSSNALY